MITEYNHRVTIACPESLINSANNLAVLVGESAHDISTFGAARYTDTSGNLFSVVSTVVKQSFIDLLASGLPATPPHALDEFGDSIADRVIAQQAFDAIQLWAPDPESMAPTIITGMLIAIDTDPIGTISEWGLALVDQSTAA